MQLTTTPDSPAAWCRLVSTELRKQHEAVAPESSGGTTGTITPNSFARVLRAMDAIAPLSDPGSVFCDVGCGTGGPSLSAALAYRPRAAIGFDCERLQVLNACRGSARLQPRLEAGAAAPAPAPVYFFQHDACALATLEPATHVYLFAAYPAIIARTAVLAARSATVQALGIVYLRRCDVEECGVLSPEDGDADPDADAARLAGLRMGTRQYGGVVVPLTPERRARILKLSESEAQAEAEVAGVQDLRAQTELAVRGEGARRMRETVASFVEEPRPKRARHN